MQSLVRTLFDGPLDIVGDVHGEIDALQTLIGRLGYRQDGAHPDDRRLVFVGDLTDRGPDSPAVIDLVQNLVDSGRAQCVLGNHDLNILLDHRKPENKWFFGDKFRDENGDVVPQILADESTRQRVLCLFRTLPLALERDDVRVVHACWHDDMIAIARGATDAKTLYEQHAASIRNDLAWHDDLDDVDGNLAHQNRNPVKMLTSGPEHRAESPFESGGKLRREERVRWWEHYDAERLCLFGHYSLPVDEPHGFGSAFCADYAIGKRWTERREPDFDGTFRRTKLAAFRFPERRLVFDDGEQQYDVV